MQNDRFDTFLSVEDEFGYSAVAVPRHLRYLQLSLLGEAHLLLKFLQADRAAALAWGDADSWPSSLLYVLMICAACAIDFWKQTFAFQCFVTDVMSIAHSAP